MRYDHRVKVHSSHYRETAFNDEDKILSSSQARYRKVNRWSSYRTAPLSASVSRSSHLSRKWRKFSFFRTRISPIRAAPGDVLLIDEGRTVVATTREGRPLRAGVEITVRLDSTPRRGRAKCKFAFTSEALRAMTHARSEISPVTRDKRSAFFRSGKKKKKTSESERSQLPLKMRRDILTILSSFF